MTLLSEAMKEAYASATLDVVLHTLEFRHPAFLDADDNPIAIRVVKDFDDLQATLESDAPMNPGETVTFQAMNFDFALPDQAENNAVPSITIALDNVTHLLMPYLDAAIEYGQPIEVTYRPYLESDLSQPHMNPPLTLILQNPEANQFRVTAQATYGDYSNKSFPVGTYNDTNFPTLLAQ